MRYTLLGLALVIAVFLGPVTPSAAESDTQSRVITLADLGYTRDETVQGIHAYREYSLRLPERWQMQPGNALTLQFSHSPALRANSSMSVDWNGTRLASTLLTSENASAGVLEIPLPLNLIINDYNKLRIEFYMGIRDDFCADVDNPAVWATVRNSSGFRFVYTPAPAVPELNRLPAPFVDASYWITNTITIAMPSAPTTADLSAVATIAARLGQWTTWRPLQLDLIALDMDTPPINRPGNLILVGDIAHLPDWIIERAPFASQRDNHAALVDASGKAIPSDAGVLWEQTSPTDSSSVILVVTGTTEDAMLMAARALANDHAIARLSGQLGIALSVPPIEINQASAPQSFTFETLGYRDQTSQGSREQSISFVFDLPPGWQIQDYAALDVHFAHSLLLDANRASLNAQVNDTPIGSLMLTDKNAQNGHAAFSLPARLLRIGENRLTLTADMQLAKTYQDPTKCLTDYSHEAWLVIYADSQISLPGAPATFTASLANYPLAFVRSNNLADVVLGAPTASNLATARAIAWVASGLGRIATADRLAVSVFDDATLAARPPTSTLQILVGRPTQNSAITNLNSFLPQPFKPQTDDAAPVRGLALIAPEHGSIGYIQSTLNAQGEPRLVVTGNSDEGVSWAADVLANPTLVNRLKGDLVVLSGKGMMATAEVRKPVTVSLAPSATASTNPTSRTPSWITLLALAVVAITVGMLAFAAWRLLLRGKPERV